MTIDPVSAQEEQVQAGQRLRRRGVHGPYGNYHLNMRCDGAAASRKAASSEE